VCAFLADGQQWSAATTDGCLIFSLDAGAHSVFDPSELTIDVTPQNVRLALASSAFAKALIMSLSLNDPKLLQLVLESTPVPQIPLVARSIPKHRLDRFLNFLSAQLASSAHLEYLLCWTQNVLSIHASTLKQQAGTLLTTFRHLAKTLTQQQKDVAQM
jgi:periodic tryptophan protein 2